MQRQSVSSGTIRVGGNCIREQNHGGWERGERGQALRPSPSTLTPKTQRPLPPSPAAQWARRPSRLVGFGLSPPAFALASPAVTACFVVKCACAHWCVFLRYRQLRSVPGSWSQYVGSNQSVLEEINPEHSLEGPMWKLKLQNFGHLMQRVDSLEKTLMQKRLGARREGDGRG